MTPRDEITDAWRPIITVTIDTEEDNWAVYERDGATSANIARLPELQDLLDRYGARPTYFVNYAPLVTRASVEVIAALAGRTDIEIGGHCHPWNTPPINPAERGVSMMSALPHASNRAKVHEVTRRIAAETGVTPVSFRCGRWALGPSVASALHVEGYSIDCSVTPPLDWSPSGGPDYSQAPRRPYRFDPAAPLRPVPDGTMLEIPATAGFLRGDQDSMSRLRSRLGGRFRHMKLLGLLERVGLLRLRRLSPEVASAHDMMMLIDVLTAAREPVLGITFHSSTLLPAATPYVRSEDDRRAFLGRLEAVLKHCRSVGCTFATIREAGAAAHA